MSKIVTLLIVIILAAAGVLLIARKSSRNGSAPEATPVVYSVLVIAPDVYIQEAGQSSRPIRGTVNIAAGTEIKTSATGRAAILYPNGTVARLEENSTVTIEEIGSGGSRSKIELVSGGLWVRIKKALNAGEYYEVETQNAVASVRGTIFAMQYTGGIADIYVLEHKVGVKAKDLRTKELIAESDTELGEEEKLSIDNKKLAAGIRHFARVKMDETDFRKKLIERNLRQMTEDNEVNTDALKKLLLKLRLVVKSPTPSVPLPTPTASIKLTVSPIITPTPSIKVLESLSPLPSPTPLPVPLIQSVVPSSISLSGAASAEVLINGQNFSGIKSVLIGDTGVNFFLVDAFSIFATLTPQIQPGVYDISVVTNSGTTLTLSKALEIK